MASYQAQGRNSRPIDSYRPSTASSRHPSAKPQGIKKQQPWKTTQYLCRATTPLPYGGFSNKPSDLEDGELTPESYGCSEISVSRSNSWSSTDAHEWLYEDLLNNKPAKWSDRILRPEVTADLRKREFHSGERSAYQFDMRKSYVRDMLHYMYERFDTVTVYSQAMLEPGDIIYYLRPFTLGLHQNDHGKYVAEVGDSLCTARMKMKGRFGIVVSVFGQCIKVVELTTFDHQGLAATKPQHLWPEYVGLRQHWDKGYLHPAPNKALEVGYSCCDIHPDTSVHLITDKISLSNQIMIAGHITSDSLARLRTMIKRVESGTGR